MPRIRAGARPSCGGVLNPLTIRSTTSVWISGTGSLICSRGEGGWIRSGGGGHLLGDSGSAFDVGQRALKLWISQGSTAPASLTNAVEHVFESTASNEVIANLYAAASPPAKLARLAPSVAKMRLLRAEKLTPKKCFPGQSTDCAVKLLTTCADISRGRVQFALVSPEGSGKPHQ